MRNGSVRVVRWTVVVLACLAGAACRGKGKDEPPTGAPRAGSSSPFARDEQAPKEDVAASTSATTGSTDGAATVGTDGGGPTEPAEPPAQLAPARPLEARLTLDPGRAVTARVAPEGGTVAAEADDGTRFTLTVPAGALIAPVRITLTPLTEAEGLPLSGGAVAGVQLEPEGLLLFHAATLTVEGPATAGTAAGRPRAVAWNAAGRNVHRMPWSGADGRRALRIVHFSGYAVGSETDEDAAAERDRMPEGWEAQTYARAVELVDRIVERQLSDPPAGAADEDAAALDRLLRDWWNGAVDPELRELAEHPERLDAFLDDYLPWTATAEAWELGGTLADRREAAEQPLGDALEHALERALDGCGDPEDGASWAGAAARRAGTAEGLGQRRESGVLGREGDEQLADCLTFELETTLTIVVPEQDGVGFRSELSMTGVRLSPAASGGEAPGLPPIEGEGELRYDSFRATLGGGGCRAADVRTTNGRAQGRLELDVQPRTIDSSPDVAAESGTPLPIPYAVISEPCRAPGESYGVRCPGLRRTVPGMAGGTAVAIKEMSSRPVNGDQPGTTRGTIVSSRGLRSSTRFLANLQGIRIEADVVHVVRHAPGGP